MEIKIGQGIRIRDITEDDVVSLVKYADNIKINNTLRDSFPYPYTKEDAENWLMAVNEYNPKRAFAIANDKEFIGAIGIEPCRDINRLSTEFGYWLGEPFWGKGIATLAVKNFVKYIFENYEFIKIFASVYSSNPASKRVLEKAGFKLEGCLRNQIVKKGKVLDELVFGILKEEVLF
jgi:RimJ/RimL family protein N-acetyltransferase